MAVARVHFFPRSGKMGDSEAKFVSVLRGSLGTNTINIALLSLYNQMLMQYENLFIIWQTGVEDFEEMQSLVKNNPRLVLTPFLHSGDLAYAAADLIVPRAGARIWLLESLLPGDESLMAEMSVRALNAAKLNASAEIVERIYSLVN